VIGLLALQIVKRTGPSVLIAVDPDPVRRLQATQLGADHVLDSSGAAEAIHEIAGGAGADTVLEISGNPGALHEAIRMVRYEGTVVAVSWYAEDLRSVNLAGEFHHNRVRIIGSQSANVNPALHPRWDKNRREQYSLTLLESLELDALLTHDFSVDEAGEAYKEVDAAPQGLIQATIRYPSTESEN
jgi:threonine dehydrogenase-like Zn-dependent dehydrogenase